MSRTRDARLSALHRRLDRQEATAGMLDSFAEGLCYGTMSAIVAFALLMPRTMLQLLDLMVSR